MKRQIGILALMMVLAIGLVSAATCVFDQTATTAGTGSTYIKGTDQNLSVTITHEASDDNYSTAVISVSSGTITGALTYNISGTNVTYMNTTVNTGALSDDTSYTFTMTLKNDTDQKTIGTCTRTFSPDNTQPICTHSLAGSSTYPPKQTWVVTGTNASSATIQFGSNTVSAMTESAAGDVFSFTGQIPESTYEVKAITSDGLNTTLCSLSNVRIDTKSTSKQVSLSGIGGAAGGAKGASANYTAIIVVIGLVALWYIRKQK